MKKSYYVNICQYASDKHEMKSKTNICQALQLIGKLCIIKCQREEKLLQPKLIKTNKNKLDYKVPEVNKFIPSWG